MNARLLRAAIHRDLGYRSWRTGHGWTVTVESTGGIGRATRLGWRHTIERGGCLDAPVDRRLLRMTVFDLINNKQASGLIAPIPAVPEPIPRPIPRSRRAS